MIILLFDIDGTLIKTGGAGGQALLEAFSETFRVREPGEVPFSGRTDRGIAQSLFRLHGIADSTEQLGFIVSRVSPATRILFAKATGRGITGRGALLE